VHGRDFSENDGGEEDRNAVLGKQVPVIQLEILVLVLIILWLTNHDSIVVPAVDYLTVR
jgi:hypothetical protein